MPPTLYLIDGHALAYRTFYALTRGVSDAFTTSQGEPTAGVYGFTSVLLRILEQEQPDYLAVVFDAGLTFRDEIYPEYKGTRMKMPDELRIQMERVRQLVDAFNIPRLELEGYEADDVLGSVAKKMVKKGLGVKIITGDRDLLQLVNDRIIVNLPGRSLSEAKDYFPEDVEKYMGVRPDQVVDFKALVGDTSDNIPGVAGVGKKTAITLLKSYNDLDNIYQHLDELTPGLRKRLEEGRESAYMSRKLAALVLDLDVNLDLERARPEHFDPAEVESLFRELEFRSLMARLTALEQSYGKGHGDHGEQLAMFSEQVSTMGTSKPSAAAMLETVVVDTPQALEALVEELKQADVIAFDTETTDTDQMGAKLVGISLAVEPGRGYYIPVGHKRGKQLALDTVIEALRGPMTDADIPKVGHNLKYDYIMLARYGLAVHPLSFDTMIAEWLINPTSRNLGLKNLAWVRKDIRMTNIQELIGKGRNQITMAEVPIEKAAPYAAQDAEVVLRLMPELKEELEQVSGTALFNEIEMPLVEVLAGMEMAGVSLDTQFLERMSDELSQRLAEIEAKVYAAVGEEFNLNSPQQLSEALFDRLGLEPPDRTKKTASGYYSTAAGVLEAMQDQHEVVEWVLEYRELSKLKSTYLDALPLQVNPETGRVHTSYNQTGVVTGRIASSDPNLQNIPIRTEIGRQVRKAFTAPPGHMLVAIDYSQVELRIVAHMAEDKAMLDAFRAGQDIHATTAAAIYGVPLEQVTKEQRRRAKGINFGLIYGMSAYGLTRATDLTLAEAENFMDAYFKKFPGVKKYLDNMRRLAAEQGFVETLHGRRRYFPRLKNQSNRNIRNREEREAINAPIQGTAADIMKVAMLRVPAALKEAGLKALMLLQVHDELVLECPEEELEDTIAIVQKVMQEAFELKVPLITEARCGRNWGEMKTIEISSTLRESS
jgi:DNA polymerase-1